MTANAFSEEKAACFSAGMNDHIGKPVDPDPLYAMLLRWLPLAGPKTETGQPDGLPASRELSLKERLSRVAGLDVACAMKCVGGGVASLEPVLHRFVRTCADGFPELMAAANEGAVAKWLAACHLLIGGTGALGALPLCEQLRSFGRELLSNRELPRLASRAQQTQTELRSFVARLALALWRQDVVTSF